MRKLLLISALVVVALLSGCQMWNPGGTRVSGKNDAFSIVPPAGWMYATSLGPGLIASKEGLVLQNLVVEQFDLTKPLPNSKRTLSATLAPFEAAEAVLDDLRANRELLGFDVKENTPTTVAGQPGFKIVFSYRTKDRLHLTEARYGTIADQKLWIVRYSAPARHYFERDLPVFEEAVRSFQLKKT
jgi:hypothetical protein